MARRSKRSLVALALAAALRPEASFAQAALEYPTLLQLQRYAQTGQIRSTAPRGSGAGAGAATSALRLAANPTQTLIVMWLVSSVQALRERNMIARIQNQDLAPAEQADAALQMAPAIFDSFDTYVGMLGGGVAGFGTALGLRATGLDSALMNMRELRAFSSSSAGRLAMRQFLVSGVVGLVTGAAWEGTIQLREEAIAGLETADEVRAARELSFWRCMVGTASPEEMRVYRKVNQNMFEILKDGDRVRHWIYNAYRLRLYRSQWVLPIAISTAVGTGAWAMAPSGPWGVVAGMLGGLAGAVGSLYVPQGVRDAVDDGLWLTRERANSSRLYVNLHEMQQRFEQQTRLPFLRGAPAYAQAELRALLRSRQRTREALVTAWMERIFRDHVAILESSEIALRLRLSLQNPVDETTQQTLDRERTLAEQTAKLEAARDALHQTVSKAVGLYREELARFLPLLDRYERDMAQEQKALLSAHLEPLAVLAEHLMLFGVAIDERSPVRARLRAENPALFARVAQTAGLQLIQWNLRGFEEDSIREMRLNSAAQTTTE